MKKEIKELISLHRDFWGHKLKKPLINNKYSLWRRSTNMINLSEDDNPETTSHSVLHPDWKGKDNMVIEPDMLIPERHQSFYEYDSGDDPVIFPVFNTIIPWTLVTWLPAIAGCKIKVSEKGLTLWPEPYIRGNWFEKEDYGLNPRSDWLDKLIEFTRYLVGKYYPSRMVSLEMFSRGPGDILLSVMDNETAYMSFFDHPGKIKDLLLGFADIHIKWSHSQLEEIPELEGGYCNQWGIWAPGKVTRVQEDFTVNLSEKHYKEFIMPADEKIIEASEYQVFHTHSGSSQYAKWVAEIEGLKVLEVTIDPHSRPLEEMIEDWKKIIEKKSMIITGSLTRKQIDFIVSKLDNSGLFLDVFILDENE